MVDNSMARRNSRHEIFAREYVKDLNGTRAAIATGYAKKSAHVTASQLLSNPKVKELLAELTKKHADKLDLTAEKVLSELSSMGFSNFLDYVNITEEGDAFVDLSGLTQEQAAAGQAPALYRIYAETISFLRCGRGTGGRGGRFPYPRQRERHRIHHRACLC